MWRRCAGPSSGSDFLGAIGMVPFMRERPEAASDVLDLELACLSRTASGVADCLSVFAALYADLLSLVTGTHLPTLTLSR